jgi:iron complex outermembrane receptor protein
MYGSDAIGGVIDMKNRNVPADNTIGGVIDLSGKTNNEFLGASMVLYGRKRWFFASFRATLLSYGDYKVPTDSVDIYSYRAALYRHHMRNTAGKEADLHFSFGALLPKFQSILYISNVFDKAGFFANAHGQEPRNVDASLHDQSNRDINYPYQEVNHFKIINNSQYRWERFKLETDLGFQRNFRQECGKYAHIDPHCTF